MEPARGVFMHRSVALGICAVVTVAASVACGQRASDSSPTMSAALSDDPSTSSLDPRVPLAAEDWVRCWFAKDGARIDLLCKRVDSPAYPYQVQDLYVSARSAATHAYFGDSGRHGPITDRNAAELRASLTRDDFPIELEVRAKVFSAQSGQAMDVFITPSEMITTKKVLGPSATESAPLVFAQPFALWPVRVAMVGSQGYEVQSPAFDVSLGPYSTTGTSPVDHASAKVASKVRFTSHTFVLPAPSGGHIDATATLHRSGGGTGASAPIVLNGPGIYIADDNGVRVATEAEAQELLPDLPPGPTPPAPTPAPTPTPDPAPTPAPNADAQAPTPTNDAGSDGAR